MLLEKCEKLSHLENVPFDKGRLVDLPGGQK